MNVNDFYEAGLFVPYEEMDAACVSEVKARLFDTVLALLGGALSSPADEVRRVCSAMRGQPGIRAAFPAGFRADLENAAFLNSWFIRHADWGDTYRRNDDIGGHPSDLIGAALALCDVPGMSGRRVLEGIWFAYGVYGVLQEFMLRKSKHLDYTTALSLTVPLLASVCFDVPRERMQNALNLSAAGGAILGEVRHGKTTNLKCGASAYAVARALWCFRLSEAFLETPDSLFDGKDGWYARISSFDATAAAMRGADVLSPVEVKLFPCFHVGQGPVECAVALHAQVKDRLEEIQAVKVGVTKAHSGHILKPGSVAFPASQSAADHNVKYGVAAALRYGALTPLHYNPECMADGTVRALFDRVVPTVWEDAPEGNTGICRVEIVLRDGTVLQESRPHAAGSFSGMDLRSRQAPLRAVLAKKQEMLEHSGGIALGAVAEAVERLEEENGCARLLDAIQACVPGGQKQKT